MTKNYNEIYAEIQKMKLEFEEECGKSPNEVHIREHYFLAMEPHFIEAQVKTDYPITGNCIAWFMDMRVFWEITSFYVSWTEETDKIKKGKK